jgi:hypothetical protein
MMDLGVGWGEPKQNAKDAEEKRAKDAKEDPMPVRAWGRVGGWVEG